MANGPDSASHKTTPYYTTDKAKGAQTAADVSRKSSLKFTDSQNRPVFGNSTGPAKRSESGGGQAGGDGIGGRKSNLAGKY